eukprot:8437616-Alexandrium_andersonii.AAC.1
MCIRDSLVTRHCAAIPGPLEECGARDSVSIVNLGALEPQGFRLARRLRPDAPGQRTWHLSTGAHSATGAPEL